MSPGFSAALLVGGRSRRMGSDKAFLPFGDPPQPLWRRQVGLLESLGARQLMLSHNADQKFATLPHGLEAVVDFAQWLHGPVFEPLHDPAYFQRFFVEAGTVTWPNGADIAPETLYEAAKSSAAA